MTNFPLSNYLVTHVEGADVDAEQMAIPAAEPVSQLPAVPTEAGDLIVTDKAPESPASSRILHQIRTPFSFYTAPTISPPVGSDGEGLGTRFGAPVPMSFGGVQPPEMMFSIQPVSGAPGVGIAGGAATGGSAAAGAGPAAVLDTDWIHELLGGSDREFGAFGGERDVSSQGHNLVRKFYFRG